MELPSARQWLLVAVATSCGLVAAYNIGKVPPSVPALRAEFATSLTWIAALVSSYSLVAMTCSLMMGRVVGWFGLWRTAACGLVFLVVGGVVGATTDQFVLLLAGRVLEGLGYLAVAVSMPAFISRICSPANRPIAMGVWGTFVPAGITICMLAAPMLSAHGGWRLLWWVGVASALVMLVVATLWIRPVVMPHALRSGPLRVTAWRSVVNRNTILLTACFAVYSMLFTGLATFLPTYWSETADLALAVATQWTALVISFNVTGNLFGGWLNKTGVSVRGLLLMGLPLSGLFAAMAYAVALSFGAQLVAACVFSFISGITPSTLFSTAAKISRTAEQNSLLVGLLFQGAGLGQVLGPLLLGAMLDVTGVWVYSPAYFLTCVALAIFLLSQLHRDPEQL